MGQPWVPTRASYVAFGRDGGTVAWMGKDFVAVVDGPVVAPPWERPSAAAVREDVRGGLCEVHFVERSVSGRCHDCDD